MNFQEPVTFDFILKTIAVIVVVAGVAVVLVRKKAKQGD
jgi:hypothetical protein